MSKVDWSLAPEECTHKDVSEYGLWYKFDIQNDAVYYWSESRGGYWSRSGIPSQYEDGSMDAMVERPSQPKPWSGPEDGLPPVGTFCELRLQHGDWLMAQIAYITETGCLWVAWGAQSETFNATYNIEFRPIRTAEQIAADKRETAIRELMDIAQVDCRVTAARLVDAGFKREVV